MQLHCEGMVGISVIQEGKVHVCREHAGSGMVRMKAVMLVVFTTIPGLTLLETDFEKT